MIIIKSGSKSPLKILQFIREQNLKSKIDYDFAYTFNDSNELFYKIQFKDSRYENFIRLKFL
jgi:hypothetical protein